MQRSDYGGKGNAAYDLSKFQYSGRKTSPDLVVKRPGKNAAVIARAREQRMHRVRVVMVVLSVFAVVSFMLYSMARLTELNQKISAAQNALNRQVTENNRLQADLEAKMSMRNIEEYATQKLGMTPMDKSQVTYVDLSDGEDKIELPEDAPKRTLLDDISLAVTDLKEYIGGK